MSTIELPDDIAAAAQAGGTTAAGLIAELVADAESDALDALIGVGASGRTGAFDVHAGRVRIAARHSADTI